MATNYKYLENYVEFLTGTSGGVLFQIIRTPLSNIETETILKPVSETSYIGINGGFFDHDEYTEPPTGGSSIVYNSSDVGKTVTVEGRTLSANFDYNEDGDTKRSMKTLVLYKSGTTTKAAYMYAKSRSDVTAAYSNITNIIGGADYNSSSWSTLAYYAPINRTVIAWADGYAYLINALVVNIPTLKELIPELGTQLGYNLTAANSVILDGSGSTCMRVNTGSEIENLGGNRHIYNMIRLTKSS